MSEQITLYLRMDGTDEDAARGLAAAVRELDSVEEVVAQEEEPVRGGVEIIQEITLTVTALGGAVGATNALIDQIRELLGKFRTKSAQVESGGSLRELPV